MTEPKGNTALREEVLCLDHLPPLSPVATRLVALAADPELKVSLLAEIIEQDPPLTARILGLANSAYFGQRNPIYSVEQAIIRVLGLNLVRSLSLSMALAGSFTVDECHAFDLSDYWLHVLVSAATSTAVGRRLNDAPDRPVDALYMSALLHQIGLLVLVHLRPVEMNAVLESAATDDDLNPVTAERDVLGLDRWQAGEWLAFRWHLPDVVIHTLANVGARSRGSRYRGVVDVVRGSSRWARSRIDGRDDSLSLPRIDRSVATAVEQEISDRLDDLRATAATFS